MTRRATTVRRRVRYELMILTVLLVFVVLVFLLRDRPGSTETVEATPFVVTPEPAPTPIPDNYLEYTEGKWVEVEYGTGNSNTIDDSGFTTPDKKTNEDLVQFAIQAWENRWGYVLGTFGDVMTEEMLQFKLEQYPEEIEEYEDFIRENWIGRRTVDCMGLIKGYGWYDPNSGAILYNTGATIDTGTEYMFQLATVKGPIETMPETPGLIVYAEGHVGVYIGDGMVIESICTEGGVVKTKLADRHFTHWMECPFIEY